MTLSLTCIYIIALLYWDQLLVSIIFWFNKTLIFNLERESSRFYNNCHHILLFNNIWNFLKLTKPKINNAIAHESPQCSPYQKEKEPALFCIITNSQRERERWQQSKQAEQSKHIRWKVEMVSTATLTTLLTRYPSLYIRIPRILGRCQVYNLLFGFEISYSYSHTHFYPSVLGGLMSPVPIVLSLNKSQRSVTSTLVSSHT